MTIRTFIFCDICNIQCIRYVEQRRDIGRGDRTGRRVTDGRAWFDGIIDDAVEHGGWHIDNQGQHICPCCWESAQAKARRHS